MHNGEITNENIQLSLPVNAAYVSAARLTASSIANRMVFDIDEIEDIKAAVSEACTFIIKNLPQNVQTDFTIVFSVEKEILRITISTQVPMPMSLLQDEMGLVMINALMDKCDITESDTEFFSIAMVKQHKEISFD